MLLLEVGKKFEFTAERVKDDCDHRQIKANTFRC